jgi:hypothetical protein
VRNIQKKQFDFDHTQEGIGHSHHPAENPGKDDLVMTEYFRGTCYTRHSRTTMVYAGPRHQLGTLDGESSRTE